MNSYLPRSATFSLCAAFIFALTAGCNSSPEDVKQSHLDNRKLLLDHFEISVYNEDKNGQSTLAYHGSIDLKTLSQDDNTVTFIDPDKPGRVTVTGQKIVLGDLESNDSLKPQIH